MKIMLALLAVAISACAAGTKQRETLVDDPFMATFELTQLDGGEATRSRMLTSATDASGHTTIYRTASVSMDQMIYIWGPGHPAIPVFFSPQLAMRFAILAGYAMQQKMSEEEAHAWAWRKLHEPRAKR